MYTVLSQIAATVGNFLSGVDWTEVFTFVIALISLSATIYFSHLQQEHNKNGVMPILDWKTNSYPEKLRILLLNKGAGPLHITKFRIEYQNKEFKTYFELLKSENLLGILVEDSDVLDGHSMSPGETTLLLTIVYGYNINENSQNPYFKILENTKVRIDYEDIYKTKCSREFKPKFAK